jgi:hypothetical protein
VSVDLFYIVPHVPTLYYVTGIAAANYSHVNYFPSSEAYNAFYRILFRVVDISFETFATYLLSLFVEHLRTVNAQSAGWYEEWWTGARGRYCICHSTHGGTNSNMGVEGD